MHELSKFDSESSCRYIRTKASSLSSLSECPHTVDSAGVAKMSVIIKSLQQKIMKMEAHNAMIVKENIEYAQSIEERERQNNLKIKKAEGKMEQLKEQLKKANKKNKLYKHRLEQIGKKNSLKGIQLVKTKQKINLISDELGNNHSQTKRIECKLKKLSRTMKSFYVRPKGSFRRKFNKSSLNSTSRKNLTKSMQVSHNT